MRSPPRRHSACVAIHMIAPRGVERAVLLGLGVAIGVGISALVQRMFARRSARPLRMQSAVPPSQLCPSEFEEPSTDSRLLRRIETVLQRRTARIVLVLERLQDGHNYAAVLRTCESLGVQHVWIVSPPKRDDLFETAARRGRENNVEFAKKQIEKEARRDSRPGDSRPTEGSKRQRRVARRARVWEETDALDVSGLPLKPGIRRSADPVFAPCAVRASTSPSRRRRRASSPCARSRARR